MRYALIALAAIVVAAAGVYAASLLARSGEALPATGRSPAATPPKPLGGTAAREDLPPDTAFATVAENEGLRLSVDPQSGHFQVLHKASGQLWRSYPDPGDWRDDVSEQRRKALLSPVSFRYVEPQIRKDQATESNLLQEKGLIGDYRATGDGFAVAFNMPGKGISIPVQVALGDGFVEVRIDDAALADTSATQLTSARVYPYFGARTSDRRDGYMLIPDGSGGLIRFNSDRAQTTAFYQEPVYGEDLAFGNNKTASNRHPVKLPVFGYKSGDTGFLAVIRAGAEYAGIFAAPSGSFNAYNWATAELTFRQRYYQPTNYDKTEGYFVYNAERFHSVRTVRYYFLTGAEADYAGMAAKYRDYLIGETGFGRLEAGDGGIPLHLKLLGGDREAGFVTDGYLPITTTDEAKQIVNQLYSLGVARQSVRYSGWQAGGFSVFGKPFPVAARIGGSEGMRSFVAFAHSLGISVFLDAEPYAYNNTGKGGYRQSRDGLRDLGASAVTTAYARGADPVPVVSPRFMAEALERDLASARTLGIDGFVFGGPAGASLHSDYNRKHAATRSEALDIQTQLLASAGNALGDIRVTDGNLYALSNSSHLYGLADDYSYDLFVDEAVPFAQMALHGLIPYSAGDMNMRDDYKIDYLRSIEYGAEPSFAVSYAPSQQLLHTFGYNRYYSTNYEDWLKEMVGQYQMANEALGDVRAQWMTGHRTLAPGVKETTYEGGKRIVVNYSDRPYPLAGGAIVQPLDFAVVEGEVVR